MASYFIKHGSNAFFCVAEHNSNALTTIDERLFSKGIQLHHSDYFILCDAKKVDYNALLKDGATYHVIERLPGGKGGFGSMLRAIGAQIDKTTNRDACRDLSGRRMRDVNNEKNLREWVAKKAERERERERRKKERRERLLAVPNHKFEDPSYHEQKQQVQEGLEDALNEGLHKAGASASSSSGPTRKRKADHSNVSKDSIKKACEWLGVDVDDLSDVDFSSDSNSEPGDDDGGGSSGYPGVSSLPTSDTGLHSDSGMGSTSAHLSGSEERASTTDTEKERKLDQPAAGKDHTTQELLATAAPTSVCEQAAVVDLANDKTDLPADYLSSSGAALNSDSQENPSNQVALGTNKNTEDLPFDLDSIQSAEELERYGLDQLKSELMARGLKCGGTLQERAKRLFSVKGLTKEQIDPSFFAKSKGKGKKK